MYDPNKHIEFPVGSTVEDLKAALAKLPPDATILCCGDDLFHLHCESDGSTVNIDTNSMEDEYEDTPPKPATICLYGISMDSPLVIYLKYQGFNVTDIRGKDAFSADILLIDEYVPLKTADPWVRRNPAIKVWTPDQLKAAYGLTDTDITEGLAKVYKASKPKMVKVVLRPKQSSRLRLPRKAKAQAKQPYYYPPCCPMACAPNPMAQAYLEACVEDFED